MQGGREVVFVWLAVYGVHSVDHVEPLVGCEEGMQHNGEQALVACVVHLGDEVDEGRWQERAILPDANGSLL